MNVLKTMRSRGYLNEHFISIKVDREERPDLDQIYMEAVQLMTGQGGWPLSVFLTPDREPFYGGTYWPARQQYGMPGFDQMLEAVAEAWQRRRQELLDQAAKVTGFLRESDSVEHDGSPVELDERLLESAESTLVQSFDPQYGGFGPAPKFPQPLALQLLLSRWSHAADDELLHIVTTTLDRMAMGGIYDQLGGGFHRYSVDARWLVPHFEKMLYDNALLTTCYLNAWQATKQDAYADVVRETLDYVLRDMTGPARWILQRRRRRQRRPRGEVLSLDSGRNSRRPGARGRRHVLPHLWRYRNGQFRGAKYPQPQPAHRIGSKNSRPRSGRIEKRTGRGEAKTFFGAGKTGATGS